MIEQSHVWIKEQKAIQAENDRRYRHKKDPWQSHSSDSRWTSPAPVSALEKGLAKAVGLVIGFLFMLVLSGFFAPALLGALALAILLALRVVKGIRGLVHWLARPKEAVREPARGTRVAQSPSSCAEIEVSPRHEPGLVVSASLNGRSRPVIEPLPRYRTSSSRPVIELFPRYRPCSGRLGFDRNG